MCLGLLLRATGNSLLRTDFILNGIRTIEGLERFLLHLRCLLWPCIVDYFRLFAIHVTSIIICLMNIYYLIDCPIKHALFVWLREPSLNSLIIWLTLLALLLLLKSSLRFPESLRSDSCNTSQVFEHLKMQKSLVFGFEIHSVSFLITFITVTALHC